jgi:hypothetical protein
MYRLVRTVMGISRNAQVLIREPLFGNEHSG